MGSDHHCNNNKKKLVLHFSHCQAFLFLFLGARERHFRAPVLLHHHQLIPLFLRQKKTDIDPNAIIIIIISITPRSWRHITTSLTIYIKTIDSYI